MLIYIFLGTSIIDVMCDLTLTRNTYSFSNNRFTINGIYIYFCLT